MFEVFSFTAFYAEAIRQTLVGMLRGDFGGIADMQALNNNGWGYVTAVAVGMSILYSWQGPAFFTAALRPGTAAMTPGCFGALASILTLAQIGNSLWIGCLEWIMNQFGSSVLESYEMVSGASGSGSLFFYSSILAPITEELLFRGFLQGRLRPFGRKFAVLGSAVLFALFHGNLMQAPYAFAAGLVLGYTAERYGVGWAIGLHALNNLVLADLLTRLLEILPPLGQQLLDGGFLLFGLAAIGILITNRHAVGDFNREGTDPRCVKCLLTSPGIAAFTALAVLSMAATL